MGTPQFISAPWRLEMHRSPARLEAPHQQHPHTAMAMVYLTDPETKKRTPAALQTARLIQAAPELYEMVTRLCEVLRHNMGADDPVPYCVEDAEALLSRITA
jgi:hypothetical protein